MTDFAPLGFQIDTGALKDAAAAARQTATDIGKVADASDKAATAASRRLDVAKKALEAEQAAARAAGEASNASVQAAEKAVVKSQAAAEAKRKEADAARALAMETEREAKALERAAGAKDKAHGAGKRATDTVRELGTAAAQAAQHFTSATQGVTALASSFGSGGIGGLTGAATSAAGGLQRILPSLGTLGTGVGVAIGAVVGLGSAFAGLNMMLAQHQDRLDQVQGRLKNTFNGSTAVAGDLYGRLNATSQSTGMGFDVTSDAFLRLARNRGDIGATGTEVLQLTELSQKLGRVSGASSGESSAAMLQLSQALASGRLQGDELRSIMEQMPALAKAIADGLGVSVGQLRNMGSEGQLTSDKVFRAILSQTEKINREFAALPDTVDQATNRMSDSWNRMLSNLGKRIDASPNVRALLGLVNAGLSSTADSLAPDTLASRADAVAARLREEQQRLGAARTDAAAGSRWWEGMAAQGYKDERVRLGEMSTERLTAELRTLRAQQARESEIASMDLYNEAQFAKPDATVTRATQIATENNKVAASLKEITTQSETVRAAIDYLEKGLTTDAPEVAAKKLATLRTELAALKLQADTTKDAFGKFADETAKMATARARYGADASFGTEVQKLLEQQIGDRGAGDEASAVSAVIARRLEEARLKAEKEAAELQKLRDAVAHGVKSREELAGFTAAQAKAAELGATVAATPDGAKLIEEARKRAVDQFRLGKQRDAQESYLPPENRQPGDVARDIEKIRRETADTMATIGGSAAQRSALQFAARLREELRTIPDGLKEAYAAASRAQYQAEQALKASDFANGYEDRTRAAEAELAVAGLIGKEHDYALTMIQAQNDARQQGVDLEGQNLERVKASAAAQAEVNAKLKEQREAVAQLDSFRSTSRSAIQSLIKGDTKGAGQQFIDYFTGRGVDMVTQGLLGKQGEAGGGLFGDLFGGLFGTGAGGARGSSPANPLYVTFAAGGGAGGVLGGLLGGAPGAAANDNGGGGGLFGGASSLLSAINRTGRTNSVTGMNPEFQSRLGGLIGGAQEQFGADAVWLNSGYRTVEHQARLWEAALEKYGSADIARKWVAPPGRSQHNFGTAADLGYASPQVQQWMMSNAGNYGLNYRLSNEDWHVELDKSAGALKDLTTSATTATGSVGSLGKGIDDILGLGGQGGIMGGAGGPMNIGPGGNAASGGGGLFGSLGLLMQIAGGGLSSLASGIGSIFSLFFHDGTGDVSSGGFGRMVPATAFANAPRYHSGASLASDERPAILQTGERVLSRLDNARLVAGVEAMSRRGDAASSGGGGNVVSIVNHNDFRGVDPSMRAFVEARIAQSEARTVNAAVVEVRDRSQKVPGYLGR